MAQSAAHPTCNREVGGFESPLGLSFHFSAPFGCCIGLVGKVFTLTPGSSPGQVLALSLRERGHPVPQLGTDQVDTASPVYFSWIGKVRYAKLAWISRGRVGEWLIPPDCKSGARKGYGGSNPSPSTI